jgi:hypothetical protein
MSLSRYRGASIKSAPRQRNAFQRYRGAVDPQGIVKPTSVAVFHSLLRILKRFSLQSGDPKPQIPRIKDSPDASSHPCWQVLNPHQECCVVLVSARLDETHIHHNLRMPESTEEAPRSNAGVGFGFAIQFRFNRSISRRLLMNRSDGAPSDASEKCGS